MAGYLAEEQIEIGRVMQRGFETIGRNASGFILLSMLLAGIPDFVLQWLILTSHNPDPQRMFAGSPALMSLGVWVLTMLSGYLLDAALVRATILDLSGRPADLRGSLVNALSLVVPMIGLAIVTTLGFFVGLVMLIVPGIIFYVLCMVAVPVLVEERRGIYDSITRSAELTRGSRWQIFGLMLIFVLVAGGLAAASANLVAGGAPSSSRCSMPPTRRSPRSSPPR